MKEKEKIIEVRNLEVETALGKSILKNVSFDIFAGEVLAVVGESGAGKSTLALALLRLLPGNFKVKGEAFWQQAGQNLLSPKTDLRKFYGRRVAYIFQDPVSFLNPTLTIGEQLAEVFVYHKKKSYRESLALSLDLLKLVKIRQAEKKLNSFAHQLSGGEAQRVLIAMALALEPQLLIADEPTSNLDVTIEMEIIMLIKEMQKRFGFAVLFITHDLSLVKYFAQRVIFLKAGRIIEQAKTGQMESLEDNYVKALLAAAKWKL